jgi:hypothetical protein
LKKRSGEKGETYKVKVILYKAGRLIFGLSLTVIFITACSPGGASSPTEDPERLAGEDFNIELPEGDPENGEYQFTILGCDGCRVRTPNGLQFISDEALPDIYERGELRMSDPAYTGLATTNEEYVIESILNPRVYLVEGWWDEESMPADYGDRMTVQQLADVLEWMRTFE